MTDLNQSSTQQPSIFPFIDDLKDYEDFKKIGTGTYGEVCKARCKDTKEFVALKHVSIKNEKNGFPQTALREIAILQGLKHENIVQLIRMCRSSRENSSRSNYYLVLEYCDHDLAGILKNTGIIFTVNHIKCIMQQILDGLYMLHNNKIVHRDLKPANILITNDGILKLADFGLSKMINSSQDNQQNRHTNAVVTLWYRAPELLLGEQNYSFEIDMWSVGCIFAELWTRSPIMRGRNEQHQLAIMSKLYGNIYWPGVENLPLYSPLELSQNNDFTVQDYMIDYKPYIQEPLAIKLINKLLALNPKKRIDVNEAVKSEFLRAESSLTGSLQSLLSNHSSMFDSNEISRIVPQQQNVQLQPRNMSKITFETIY